jgi:hypothetical protein
MTDKMVSACYLLSVLETLRKSDAVPSSTAPAPSSSPFKVPQLAKASITSNAEVNFIIDRPDLFYYASFMMTSYVDVNWVV